MEINGVSQAKANYYAANSTTTTEVVSTSEVRDYVQSENSNNVDQKALDKAVKKLNKFLEDDNTHAEYSVHEDFNTIMIKIVDDKTKEVLMEIPPRRGLDMVASICKQFGLLDKKA